MKTIRTIIFFVFALTLFALTGNSPVEAQSRSVTVTRRDIDITLQKNGDAKFVETWQVQFSGTPPFTFAFRGVQLKNVVSVDGFQVSEGGRAYQESSSEAANTFRVYQEKGQQFAKWFFPPTTNQSRTFTIQYTMHGVIRIYDGGDQFWGVAIEGDRGYSIGNSTITVHLPGDFPGNEIKAAITLGSGDVNVRDGQTVIFSTRNLGGSEVVEIRVQFPHGIVTAAPPPWQAAADAEAVAREQREQFKGIFNLIFLFIGFVMLLIGPVLLYLLWYMKGRDAPAHVVAASNAPPSDMPPGLAGTLIDEHAEMKDIIATIIDLARRGAIKMTEKQEPGFLGIGTNRDFTFELADNQSNLRPYEQTLIRRLFGGGSSRDLSDLKEKFYTAIPDLQTQMYNEVTKLGFFAGNPNSTRAKYAGLGVAALVISGGIGFCGFSILQDLSDLAWCPGAALIAGSVGLLVLSPFMPRRTPKGATEKAKWVAFKRYLENIEKYTKLEEAKDLFDKYLPYAIAFGLENSWVNKFSAIDTPAPIWYAPYSPYGYPHHGGMSTGGSGGGSSSGGRPSGSSMPSLNDASKGAIGGLNSMTTGLFTMLNSTSSILTSAPSSKGGGGGGWSGGGGGGGGGSGGGSSGFG